MGDQTHFSGAATAQHISNFSFRRLSEIIYEPHNTQARCFINYTSCSSNLRYFFLRHLEPTRLLCPWDLPGKNTGMGCHSFLQGMFLTQGSNPSYPSLQADSLPLSHQGIPDYVSIHLSSPCHFDICF